MDPVRAAADRIEQTRQLTQPQSSPDSDLPLPGFSRWPTCPVARRDAALASGAQLITTDFPSTVPVTEGYAVWLDAQPSQCNPVTARTNCDTTTLEP